MDKRRAAAGKCYNPGMELKRNKKAYFDYSHVELFDAGIVLTGAEVKSVKGGLVNMEGSYVRIRDGEAWIIGMKIAPYPKAGAAVAAVPADRTRKLLLTKKELAHLAGAGSASGLTVVPLFVYSSKRFVKIKIALARGKRKFDKRETIKKRDIRRRLESRVRR